MTWLILAAFIATYAVLVCFVIAKGRRKHRRLMSMPRRYAPTFEPRHAKPASVEDPTLTPEMGLAA